MLLTALKTLNLYALASNLDDFLARATKQRLSPEQLVEEFVRTETIERERRSMERRLRKSKVGTFKPMADFDWNWPKPPYSFVCLPACLPLYLPRKIYHLIRQSGDMKKCAASEMCAAHPVPVICKDADWATCKARLDALNNQPQPLSCHSDNT